MHGESQSWLISNSWFAFACDSKLNLNRTETMAVQEILRRRKMDGRTDRNRAGGVCVLQTKFQSQMQSSDPPSIPLSDSEEVMGEKAPAFWKIIFYLSACSLCKAWGAQLGNAACVPCQPPFPRNQTWQWRAHLTQKHMVSLSAKEPKCLQLASTTVLSSLWAVFLFFSSTQY